MRNAAERMLFLVGVMALVLVLGCGGGEEAAPPAEAPPAAAAPVETGTLTGSVTLADGEDPDALLRMDADPVCAGLHDHPVISESRVSGEEGELANVFVYVKSGLEAGSFPVPSEPAVLDQIGCIYTPRIVGVMVGQKIKVVNQDPTLHNVHALPEVNQPFNQAQPFQGMELEKTFDKAEIMIPIKCDVHPWMISYMGVIDHPFFSVSAPDGTFTIEDLPAGTYTVEAWHELLGTQTAEVTVGADGAQLDFSFTVGG